MLPLEMTLQAMFDRFIVVAGIIVFVVVIIRGFSAIGKKDWTETVGLFVVGFVLFGFLSASAAAVALVEGLWHLIIGG